VDAVGRGERDRLLLLVGVEDPGELVALLDEPAASGVAVLEPARRRPLAGLPAGLAGWADPGGRGWDLVELPADGPASALALAVRELAEHLGARAARTAVVVRSELPPAPDLLAEVAAGGLTPAVDLTRVRWVDEGGVWVAGPAGVAHLRGDVRDHDEARDLARAVCALCPRASWRPAVTRLAEVAAGRATIGPQQWSAVLRARYVTVVADVLDGGGHGG
jgi:hypothetical protein